MKHNQICLRCYNKSADRTYTKLYPLDGEGRVAELARIISGDQITPIALANAREMLGLAP